MNPPQVNDHDDIKFLIATPRGYSGTEATRVQPEGEAAPAHDACTRRLHRLEPDAATLWREAAGQGEQQSGLLVGADSSLDTPYAKTSERGQRHGSGQQHAVVAGLPGITLLWTAGDRHMPVDSRRDDTLGEALTPNDPFQALLKPAHERGLTPACGVLDRGDSRVATLKLLPGWGWGWRTRLQANRLVTPDRRGVRAVARMDPAAAGTSGPLQGYGRLRFFKRGAPDGDLAWGASHDLQMTPLRRVRFAGYAWTLEP